MQKKSEIPEILSNNKEQDLLANVEMLISYEQTPDNDRYLSERKELFNIAFNQLMALRPRVAHNPLMIKMRDLVCINLGITEEQFHSKCRRWPIPQTRYMFLALYRDYINKHKEVEESFYQAILFCGIGSSGAYLQEPKYRAIFEMTEPQFYSEKDKTISKQYQDIKLILNI